jgi:hypothetical protein
VAALGAGELADRLVEDHSSHPQKYRSIHRPAR